MKLKIFNIGISCDSWDDYTYLVAATSFEEAKSILKAETGFDYDNSEKLENSPVANKGWEEIKFKSGIIHNYSVRVI